MTKDELKKLESMPFEKALEALEAVVARMESGNMPLDEMMKAYEEGRALSDICGKKLTEVERKIEVLRKKGGEPEWEEFREGNADRMAAPAGSADNAADDASSSDEPELF